MKISDLKLTLSACNKIKRPVFIWGEKGLGKTQSVRQWAKENGYTYIPLYLGPMADTSDILGIQEKREDGTFFHTRPDWFPTSGKNVIHLDEFNRCHPDLVQSMLSFVQLGMFHQHKLPEDTFFVGTGNNDNERYITTSVSDAALLGRFIHVELEPEVSEWLLYAEKNNVSDTVLKFISDNPEMLIRRHGSGGFDFNQLTEDPRQWLETISPLEKIKEIDHIRYEIYQGVMGKPAAAKFLSYLKTNETRLDYKEVLKNYNLVRPLVLNYSSKEESRLDQLTLVVDQIIAKVIEDDVTEDEVDNFKSFLLDIPLELSYKVASKLEKSKCKYKNQIVNDPEFIKNFTKKKISN